MDALEHYAAEGPIYFYGGLLSSFARRPILRVPMVLREAGVPAPLLYEAREIFFQASKATNWTDHEKVRLAQPDCWKAKQRGQRIQLRDDWEQIKYAVMLDHILLELDQDPALRTWLLMSGSRLIAEDSPTDFIWGIRDSSGGMGGQNLLGLAWMHAREMAFYPLPHLAAADLLYGRGWVRDTGTMALISHPLPRDSH